MQKVRGTIMMLAFGVAACGGGGGDGPTNPQNPGNPNNPGSPMTPVATNSVQVKSNFFDPEANSVSPGSTVTWTVIDGTHNVTFASGTSSPPNLNQGQTFSRGFPNPGTFNYNCTLHPGMNGSVVVQ